MAAMLRPPPAAAGANWLWSAQQSTRQLRCSGTAAYGAYLIQPGWRCACGRGAHGRNPALLAGGLRVAVARQQRGGGLHDLVGELPLAGEQLLGEVVTAGHDVLRLGQPVRERHV